LLQHFPYGTIVEKYLHCSNKNKGKIAKTNWMCWAEKKLHHAAVSVGYDGRGRYGKKGADSWLLVKSSLNS